jgi:FkbM family methyltransferase
MNTHIVVSFSNDNNIELKIPTNLYYSIGNNYSTIFKARNNHEVMFRRIITYMITNDIIKGNIIDLGAWIGDNSIPWAVNLKDNIVYAIDPSPNNIEFIESTCVLNNIKNMRTIETAISDKNEMVYTNGDINHTEFSSKGKNAISAVSLDYLHMIGVVKDVGFIHLDVEGYESKVIHGSKNLIDRCRPILSIEQHLTLDNYKEIIHHFESLNYSVYIINEILPGCNWDCRNFLAFPNELSVDIEAINRYLGNPILLLMSKTTAEVSNVPPAIVFGTYMSGNVFRNVQGFKHVNKNLHIYPVYDSHFTKMVITDLMGNWVEGKFLLGHVNTSSAQNVSNAYDSAQGVEKIQAGYNIVFEK